MADEEKGAPAGALTTVESKALATFGTGDAFMLAEYSDEQVTALATRVSRHLRNLRRIKEETMVYGVDYGVPGMTEEEFKKRKDAKPSIYKPGVEKLLALHGMVADLEIVRRYGDPENVSSPAISIDAICRVHKGSLDGPAIAVGVASRNSKEVKYAYRNESRKCPECGKPTIIVSKFVEKDGSPFAGLSPWFCMDKKGGCGSKFAPDDPRIKDAPVGKVANPDIFDVELVLVKMSAKSSVGDATLRATMSSDLFTVDLEDLGVGARASGTDDAIIGEMYGRGESGAQVVDDDPDGWRGNPAGEPKPNGKASPATDSANLASDKQKGMIESLAQKKLPGGKAKLDAWLADNRKPSLAALSKTAASAVIGALQKMEDVPATTYHDKAAQTNYTKTVQRVKDLLFEVEGREKRKVWDKREDGEWRVVGEDELELLAYVEPVALSALGTEELIKLGQHLKARVEGAAA